MTQTPFQCGPVFLPVDLILVLAVGLQQIKLVFFIFIFTWSLYWNLCCAGSWLFFGITGLHFVRQLDFESLQWK